MSGDSALSQQFYGIEFGSATNQTSAVGLASPVSDFLPTTRKLTNPGYTVDSRGISGGSGSVLYSHLERDWPEVKRFKRA
jgi:hypothetical protein